MQSLQYFFWLWSIATHAGQDTVLTDAGALKLVPILLNFCLHCDQHIQM